MWEAIASNQRRSLVLICVMGAVLIALGAVIGLLIMVYVGPAASPSAWPAADRAPRSLGDELVDAQAGAYFGVAVAVGLWLILWVSAVGAGDSILLKSARAREIRKEEAPQLWNIVEEMTIASGLAKMPRVFIIDDPAPNAFAVGYRPQSAAVAVTAGLLKRLDRDELQGVIAHEMGHIRNLDVRFMTLAGVMLGAIVLISQIFLRGMFYSGGGRRRSSRGGGGQAQLVMLVVAILVAILAPLAAQILYFACSRRREFLADASAAEFTRYPEGLASALEKIAHSAGAAENVNKVVAPMYIVNPLQDRSAFSLMATHPDTKERIRILRGMAGAGLAAYEAAFKAVRGAACLSPATLKDADEQPIRAAVAEPKTREQAVERAQAVSEVLDRVLALTIIPCMCGVKLKLPPGFKRASIQCPRCGRQHPVPTAGVQSGSAAPSTPGVATEPMRYRRRGTGWETFQCGACGHPVQLSPTFNASSVSCPKCSRRIEIITRPRA